MTLWIKVVGMNKVKNVRVLQDCTQKSYISESLAAEFGLPIVSKESIAHTLFEGARNCFKIA